MSARDDIMQSLHIHKQGYVAALPSVAVLLLACPGMAGFLLEMDRGTDKSLCTHAAIPGPSVFLAHFPQSFSTIARSKMQEERFSRKKKKKITWKIRHVRRCAHHSSRAEARRRHVEERCPALQCIFADGLGQSRPGSDSVYGLRINPYVIEQVGDPLHCHWVDAFGLGRNRRCRMHYGAGSCCIAGVTDD